MPQQPQPMQPAGLPQSEPEFAPPMGSPTPLREPGIGMSSDEMKASLGDMLSQLVSKYDEFKNNHSVVQEQLRGSSSQILGDLFDFFSSVGVDPNNPEEVLAYVQKLKQTSPELAAQLESVLAKAMGGGQEEQPDMNIESNEALPENL